MYNGGKSRNSSLSASRSLAVDFVWLDATHAASMWSAAAIITSGDIISVVMARTIPVSAMPHDLLVWHKVRLDRPLHPTMDAAVLAVTELVIVCVWRISQDTTNTISRWRSGIVIETLCLARSLRAKALIVGLFDLVSHEGRQHGASFRLQGAFIELPCQGLDAKRSSPLPDREEARVRSGARKLRSPHAAFSSSREVCCIQPSQLSTTSNTLMLLKQR
jgi:hypothetical protein